MSTFSILSERVNRSDSKPNIGGKIRPGIKVPTKTAANNPIAKAIYDAGVIQRRSFTEIEKDIREKTKIENPLYPRNAPYFTVHADDFGMPEVAEKIIDLYGEVKEGDPVKRLYRFPVTFHSDDLNEVFPNEFKRYGGTPNYESFYTSEGTRMCRYLPEVDPDAIKQQRAMRIVQKPRREKEIRGVCNPGECREFQTGQCKFRGRLLFYIPGITTGLLAMESTSEYAAEAIWSDLELIRNLFTDPQGRQRIPRFNPANPDQFIFFITKVQQRRTYFDEDGKKKTGLQWVPKLESSIDIGAVLARGQAMQIAMQQPAKVVYLENAESTLVDDAAEVQATPAPDLCMSDGATVDMETGEVIEGSAVKVDSNVTRTEPIEPEKKETSPKHSSSVMPPLEQLREMCEAYEISDEQLFTYLDRKLAKGWEHDDRIHKAVECIKKIAETCEHPGHFIEISNICAYLDLPTAGFSQYVVMKYGKGFSKNKETLRTIAMDLHELLEHGKDWAKTHLQAEIDNLVAI